MGSPDYLTGSNTMPYKMSEEEKIEATTEFVREQSWEELTPHIIRWLQKHQWAWESFEEWRVDELVNEGDDYDGNGYEG
jgi:hypothetical protein